MLGIAYNVLCGGTCLQDMELRRKDEVYLDALGAQRIPDPTTAGDFCRRFDEGTIEALQTAINETRLRVWRAQPAAFFEDAVIDADGTLAETTGQRKERMDIAYTGVWGYHPLVVSLRTRRSRCSWSTVAATAHRRKARRRGSIRRTRYVARRAFNAPRSAATPISRRRPTWIGGTATGCDSCLATMPAPMSSARPTPCQRAPGRRWCGARRTQSRPSRASGPRT